VAALLALGVEPFGAVSIEDSPAGIASARAAGLFTVGVTNTFRAADLVLADVVVGSLAELTPARLASFLARRAQRPLSDP
jgi:beta-phosphoglucomutase-like phosphatase (HAD superfamily)